MAASVVDRSPGVTYFRKGLGSNPKKFKFFFIFFLFLFLANNSHRNPHPLHNASKQTKKRIAEARNRIQSHVQQTQVVRYIHPLPVLPSHSHRISPLLRNAPQKQELTQSKPHTRLHQTTSTFNQTAYPTILLYSMQKRCASIVNAESRISSRKATISQRAT